MTKADIINEIADKTNYDKQEISTCRKEKMCICVDLVASS
jgi:hypothetical protein